MPRMRSVQDHLAAVLAAVGPVAPLDVVLRDARRLHPRRRRHCNARPAGVRGRGAGRVRRRRARDRGRRLRERAVAARSRTTSGRAPVRCGWSRAPRCGSRPGGRCPLGADAVVPLEETDRGTARVAMQRPAVAGQHVRAVGVRRRARATWCSRRAPGSAPGSSRSPRRWVAGGCASTPHRASSCSRWATSSSSPARTPTARHGVFETDGHALEAAVRDAGAARVRVGILPRRPRGPARGPRGPAGPRRPARHHRRPVRADARHRQGRAGHRWAACGWTRSR